MTDISLDQARKLLNEMERQLELIENLATLLAESAGGDAAIWAADEIERLAASAQERRAKAAAALRL